MVKYIISISCLIISIKNCAQKRYKIEKNQYGEPLLNDKAQYSFINRPSDEDLKKIDTTAYYVQVFEGRYYNEEEKRNPGVLIFHNDGFFKRESVKYFGKFNNTRKKNSIYYGGKYQVQGNKILIEQFGKYPDTKWWYRRTTKGEIEGNKIIFKDENSIFEKKKALPKTEN